MNKNTTNIGKESEHVEFKKSTGELKEGIISIVSILNKHEEGDLYFGVKNNGDVVGQDISESTLRNVSQAIRAGIKPVIYPVIETQEYDGKHIVHVGFEGKRRPYTAFNIPRIRIADEDTVMDQELYREMLNLRENRTTSWETRLSKYHINDIDMETMSNYLEKAKEAGRITFSSTTPSFVMTKLELTDGDTLLNAGAALFVDCGINELQMAKFATDERLTFNDIRRYTGSIFSLANKAVQYVVDGMDWRVEFDGSLERKEFPEIPVSAIREAVINAFGHRVIESMQAVEVAIYKNYIDIYSPGPFPSHTNPEQFIWGDQKPVRRNPLITRTLYYSKDMESFATGLKRIHDDCDAVGVRVEFLQNDYGFTVRFYRHCGEDWGRGVEKGPEKGPENELKNEKGPEKGPENELKNEKGPEKGPETKKNEINQRCEEVLKYIQNNSSVSRAVLIEELNLSEKQIRIAIERLKASGSIHFEGTGKGGRWVVGQRKND